tara:strand:+ start:3972 stop:4145 length:174 start_codon:yes stop_codon:yes gene_type:complete
MAQVRAGVVQQKCHELLGLLSFLFIHPKSLSPPARSLEMIKKFSKEILEIDLRAEIL